MDSNRDTSAGAGLNAEAVQPREAFRFDPSTGPGHLGHSGSGATRRCPSKNPLSSKQEARRERRELPDLAETLDDEARA
jgi:hypothetical protein